MRTVIDNMPVLRTVDQVMRDLAVFTDEQKSLAYCPMPPLEYRGTHDCRIGGDCGLDFSQETRRSRWITARFRMAKALNKGML